MAGLISRNDVTTGHDEHIISRFKPVKTRIRLINYRKSKHGNSLSGGILIKGSKPKQVLDIDTPVIGPNTLKLANKAKLAGLVIESNKVILVNKDLIIDLLECYNMFLFSTNFFKKNLQC